MLEIWEKENRIYRMEVLLRVCFVIGIDLVCLKKRMEVRED